MVTQISSTSPSARPLKDTITIRAAHLWEGIAIGKIAAEAYYDSALMDFTSPHRAQYYSHYERGFIHRAWKRMFDPRNLTVVAVTSSHPNTPVGYAQFVRLGDDEGAKRQIKSRDSFLLRIFAWIFVVCSLVVGWILGGDKSADIESVRAFEADVEEMNQCYWNAYEERKNRWHAQSVVVENEWQGMGIGKKLMAEVIARAESENVVVGLEATELGEFLYRSVGFALLGRFKNLLEGGDIEKAGGAMIWMPSAWKGRTLKG